MFASMIKVVLIAFDILQQTLKADVFRTKNYNGRIRVKLYVVGSHIETSIIWASVQENLSSGGL